MKQRSALCAAIGLLLLVSVSPVLAANALPVVTTFTVPATAVSPIPVTAFVATDSDGTVVGYMITQTSQKPASNDPKWTSTRWASFATSSTGVITLYAWAKDNAGGVSNSKTASTTVVAAHTHPMDQVVGLTSALAGKADVAHNHDSVYQKKYANVIVVAKSGGDFTDPVAAVNSIIGASANNPYLVKVMPGVYDVGSIGIAMKSYVDLEGSGELVTIIRGSASGEQGVVTCASNTELRDLTVQGVGAGPGQCAAIYLADANPTSISRVTALASNPANNAAEAIFGNRSSVVYMKDVTAQAYGNGSTLNVGIFLEQGTTAVLRDINVVAQDGSSDWGLYLNCNATINGVTVSSSGSFQPTDSVGVNIASSADVTMDGASVTSTGLGIQSSGVARIDNSRVSATVDAISAGGSTFMANTLVDGPIVKGQFASFKCLGVHNATYDPLICP